MGLKILIADDHKIVRDGLRTLLHKEHHVDEIYEAENGRDAVDLVEAEEPDLAIIDISMPLMNGLEACRKIKEGHPDIKILVLSMHKERHFVSDVLSAGALGYLLKECAFEELSEAIRKVMNGQIYLSQNITGIVVEDYVRHLNDGVDEDGDDLTSREREVLQLLAEGKSTKEIADMLYLSRKTIETYRQRLKEKLQVDSIAELTKYAIREGYTSLE